MLPEASTHPEQQPTRTVALYPDNRHRAARSELTDDLVQNYRRGDENSRRSNQRWPIDMFRESRSEGRAQSSVQWIPVRRYAQAEFDANGTVRSFGAPRRIANCGSGDANVDVVVYRQLEKRGSEQ